MARLVGIYSASTIVIVHSDSERNCQPPYLFAQRLTLARLAAFRCANIRSQHGAPVPKVIPTCRASAAVGRIGNAGTGKPRANKGSLWCFRHDTQSDNLHIRCEMATISFSVYQTVLWTGARHPTASGARKAAHALSQPAGATTRLITIVLFVPRVIRYFLQLPSIWRGRIRVPHGFVSGCRVSTSRKVTMSNGAITRPTDQVTMNLLHCSVGARVPRSRSRFTTPAM